MSKFILTAVLAILNYCLLGQNSVFQWVNTFEYATTPYNKCFPIAQDSAGNVYMAGNFYDIIDVDPSFATYTLSPNGTNFLPDVFVVKYDPIGNLIWAKSFGGDFPDYATAIALDANNNLYVTGMFSFIVDFAPGPLTYTLDSNNGNGYIVKFDAAGNFLWAGNFGGKCHSIEVDGGNNVVITGDYGGTKNFDLLGGTFNLTSSGLADVFICKYTTSGNLIWAKSMGGSAIDEANGLKIDQAGNIYSSGFFEGSGDFDPGSGVFNLTSAGSDIYISKLDASGSFIWAKQISSNFSEATNYLALDNSGDLYMIGLFYLTVDFNPGTAINNLVSYGGTDIFLLKLDTSGNYIWAKNIGGLQDEYGLSLQFDNYNDFYITGNFSQTVDFDPGVGSYNMTSSGAEDIFIAKYDNSGNLKWAEQIGSLGIDRGHNLSINKVGDVLVSGVFQGVVDFDPGSGLSIDTSWSFMNAFMLKLRQPTIGINELISVMPNKIWPNPTTGSFNIEVSETSEVIIANGLGEIMLNEKYSKGKHTFNLTENPQGIYFVKVHSDSHQQHYKIIKSQ